ncbi:MAG: hypothetical protein EOP48_18980 [Sphingobacteriales bacterium]|nr:MAG: hypothetical protein EOP48_18980 [Sphingobacteriales bacterium]
MTRLVTFLSIAIFCSACISQNPSKERPSLIDDATLVQLYERDTLPNGDIRLRPNYSLHQLDTSNIELTTFDTIPETISAVGTFYSYDTTKLAVDSYLFVTNLTEFGILRNKGKHIYLKKEHEKCVQLSDTEFQDVYSGNGWTAKLTHKMIEHNDGASYEKGTLEIQNSRYQIVIKVHGGYRL